MEEAIAQVGSKLERFSHTEFSGAIFRDPKRAIETGVDLFHGHRALIHFNRVDPLKNAPLAVLENPWRNSYLIGKYKSDE